jgi:N-acetylmuramic acid 6-phosphate etherase
MSSGRRTESSGKLTRLEDLSTKAFLEAMNREDQGVALAVEAVVPAIAAFVDALLERFRTGCKVFYIGAGTSGRLGILDASELPPTFGLPFDTFVGLIAGGDTAIRKAVEFAEDSKTAAWEDLLNAGIKPNDVLLGITASGTTPYVLAAMEPARSAGVLTAGLTCNPGSPLSELVDFPIEVDTGPEIIRGSTRLKAGTAQKLVLNMISTCTMVQMGHIRGNQMVDMMLSNRKLWERGCNMLVEMLGCSTEEALSLLEKHGSVRAVLQQLNPDAQ